MSESLWLDLDNTLATEVTARLGLGSGYTSLLLRTSRAVTLRDAWDWSSWTLPACAVVGQEATRRAGSHGEDAVSGAGPHYSKTYPYWLAVVCREATDSAATASAKILESRTEAAMRTLFRTLSLQDSRGERVQAKRMLGSRLYTIPERTATNTWLGLALVSLEFDSFI